MSRFQLPVMGFQMIGELVFQPLAPSTHPVSHHELGVEVQGIDLSAVL